MSNQTFIEDATDQQLKDALKSRGYGLVLWSPGDFPSQSEFDGNIKYVIDACVEAGNQAISELCS